MPRFQNLLSLLLLSSFAAPCQAKLINTYDLTTLCFLSTDIVEARLTRHHLPGQEEWKDTFTATVLNPLESGCKAGDKISRLALTLYAPARTGQNCLLFLTRKQDNDWQGKNPPPVRPVDMLLIDSQNRVRRYFQWSNPGGLVAEHFVSTEHPPPPSQIKTMRVHGTWVYTYQEHNTFEENDAAEQRFRPLAEERSLIVSRWAAAKKMKTPPYQVLHQTER